MRRADVGKCSDDPSGEHPWIDSTKKEEGNQGLRRYTCAACGKQAMEISAGTSDAPWNI